MGDSKVIPEQRGTLHVPQMDVLRALAITCVFLQHLLHNAFPTREFEFHGMLGYGESPLETYLLFLFGPGHLGVVLFFLISGFCIRLSTCRESVLDYRKFLWKRLWRITPPYWICLGALVFLGYNRPAGGYGLPDVLLHAGFLHNATAQTFRSINGPFWSIVLEVQTYAMFPILLFMIGRLGKIRTGAILAVFALISPLVARPSVQGILHAHALCGFLGRSPLTLWFAWYLGLVLADDHLEGKLRRWNTWGLVILALCLFPLMSMILALCPLGEVFNALLVYLIAERLLRTPLPGNGVIRAVSLIGMVSYSIYLWFDPILWIASQWGLSHGMSGFRLVAAGVLVVFPAVIALSYLLFRFVETPSIQLGKILYGKMFTVLSTRSMDAQ
jgi:peptidoglycan/LPS O-acetylase OafA/YrhL